MNNKFLSSAALIAAVSLGSQMSGAAMLDLTGGGVTSGVINGVTFTWDQLQPTGTGVLDPFVRIQRNGTEQGYNTSVNNAGQLPFEEKFGTFTHDVLFTDLEVNNGNYQFVLDIGEPVGQNESLLSLDGVRLYATNTPGQKGKGTDGAGDWDGPTDAILLWDMDAGSDNYVMLDANRNGKPGNGVSDMRMDVPQAIIDAGANAGFTNFILWSRFGLNEQSSQGSQSFGTFEEWAHVTGQNGNGGGGPGGGVPTPTPLLLLALGAVALGLRVRRLGA